MPIEIRELAIKISLSDENNAAGGSSSSGGSSQDVQQALIETITDKVLAILREQQER